MRSFVAATLEAEEGLEVFQVASGFEALSVHAVVDGRDRDAVLVEVRNALRDTFGIGHATVQLEGSLLGMHCADRLGDEPGNYGD